MMINAVWHQGSCFVSFDERGRRYFRPGIKTWQQAEHAAADYCYRADRPVRLTDLLGQWTYEVKGS